MDFDGYFFDLDGTILLGDRLLPGVSETLSLLRKRGKRIMFLSNTTTRTRTECQLRLEKLGLEAYMDEVVTAAYAAAVYLRDGDVEPCVFVVGEPAIGDELDGQGVQRTLDPMEATHVLVGMDMHFDYRKLHQALKAVRNGAALIAANPDPNCPIENDVIPDTWSMVKAIEAASCMEISAVIGKPSVYYAVKVLEWSGLKADRCLMVGDRLETDILFGHNHGLRTALVLTGVTSMKDMELFPVQPDYVWSSMHEFVSLIRTAQHRGLA
jgi:phosphoglycolate/pyridoxal phosphate phosphatase family enzyme